MPIPQHVIIGLPAAASSIPSGWSRVTSIDGKHIKSIPTSATAPGTTGGNAQHHHTTADHQHTLAHTHVTGGNTAAASGTVTHASTTGVDSQTTTNHTHAVGVVASSADSTPNDANSHPNSDDIDLDPARWDTIWIESDGTPTSIPEGAITFYNNSNLPASWTQPANGKDKFLRGAAAAGDGGGTGGGNTHTHAGGSHAHASTHGHPSGTTGGGGNISNNAAGTTVAALDTHTHTYSVVSGDFGSSVSGNLATSGTATAAAAEPPWIKQAVITPPAGGGAVERGIIALWLQSLASIPLGWVLCDGTKGTPNLCQGLFVKGCNLLSELLATGGNASHTHTGANHTHTWSSSAHTHTLTVNATSDLVGGTGTAITASSPSHTHATTTSSAASALTVGNAAPALIASTDNNPAYIEVAFIQYQGVIAAEYASYSLTGQDVALSQATPRTVGVLTQYSVDGMATRRYGSFTGKAQAKSLAADYGAYVYSGQTTTEILFKHRLDAATAGSYSLSGQDVTLTKATARTLAADYGAYSLSGQDVTLSPAGAHNVGKIIQQTPWGMGSRRYGTFSKLNIYSMLAAQGGYAISGQDVNLLFKHRIDATTNGTYSLTGQDVNWKLTLGLEQGSYSLGGQAAGLLFKHNLDATTAGSYLLNGQVVSLTKTGARSIIASQGAYSLSGQSVDFRQFKIAAAQGAYSLLGQAVGFLKKPVIGAAQGGYTYSGQLVNVLFGRKLGAAQGGYALSGQDANLLRGKKVISAQGSYTVSGQAINFIRLGAHAVGKIIQQAPYGLGTRRYGVFGRAAHVMAASGGSYALSGPATGLVYTPVSGTHPVVKIEQQKPYGLGGRRYGAFAPRQHAAYTVTAAQGGYSLTGQTAALRYAIPRQVGKVTQPGQLFTPHRRYSGNWTRATRVIVIAQGTYALSGQTIGVTKQKRIASSPGSYTLSGQSVNLVRPRTVTATRGNYSANGFAAALVYLPNSPRMLAALGNYTIAPQTTGLVYARRATVDYGAYSLSGQSVTFSKTKLIEALPRAYVLFGQSVGLERSRIFAASQGSYSLTGQQVSLVKPGHLAINAAHGLYSTTGQVANLTKQKRTIAQAGNYVISAEATGLRWDQILETQGGAYSVSGQEALFSKAGAFVMDAERGLYTQTGFDFDVLLRKALAADVGQYRLTGYAITPPVVPHIDLNLEMGSVDLSLTMTKHAIDISAEMDTDDTITLEVA